MTTLIPSLRRRRTGGELAVLDERELGRRVEAACWRLGYRVRRPPSDSGVHLLVDGDGVTVAVEPRRVIDEAAVHEAAAYAARRGCERAVVVTPGRIEGRARRAAAAAGVELLGPRALRRLLVAGGA